MTTWSRRGFLGLIGSGTALASLASLRALPAGAAVRTPGAAVRTPGAAMTTPVAVRFFAPGETEILT